MAMIQCPNCGEDISDKAKNCIHCGYKLQEEPKYMCEECGTELEYGLEVCPKCGCPVNNNKEKENPVPQQVEVTGVRIKSKTPKRVLIISLIVVVVAICAGVGVKKHNEKKIAEQEKKAAEEAAQLSADYENNLETITYKMVSGAATAETCCNLIKSVWYNSIYEEKDSSTDKYTRENDGSGSFYDDFNDALGNLFADSDFQDDITSIKDNRSEVASLMKEMKNPPEEWEDAYDDLKELYDAYTELTNLAVNPTGSLQNFSTNFNDADTNVSNLCSKMLLNFE